MIRTRMTLASLPITCSILSLRLQKGFAWLGSRFGEKPNNWRKAPFGTGVYETVLIRRSLLSEPRLTFVLYRIKS